MLYLIIGLIVVLGLVAAFMMRGRADPPPLAAPDAAPQAAYTPSSEAQARAQAITEEYQRTAPPSRWSALDAEDAVRPEVDAQALAAARASVSSDIPDDVLEEMLFQVSPQQTAVMFSGVSSDVMTEITSHTESGVHYEGLSSQDDLAALSGLGSAIDDLDIWDFADDASVKA